LLHPQPLKISSTQREIMLEGNQQKAETKQKGEEINKVSTHYRQK
jgi:hypothetical protein